MTKGDSEEGRWNFLKKVLPFTRAFTTKAGEGGGDVSYLHLLFSTQSTPPQTMNVGAQNMQHQNIPLAYWLLAHYFEKLQTQGQLWKTAHLSKNFPSRKEIFISKGTCIRNRAAVIGIKKATFVHHTLSNLSHPPLGPQGPVSFCISFGQMTLLSFLFVYSSCVLIGKWNGNMNTDMQIFNSVYLFIFICLKEERHKHTHIHTGRREGREKQGSSPGLDVDLLGTVRTAVPHACLAPLPIF